MDYVAPNKAKVCAYHSHAASFDMRAELDSDTPFLLQAIHKLTDYLSYQVRLVARELVDAFDLPDLIIRAPIGMQSEAYAQYTQHVGF